MPVKVMSNCGTEVVTAYALLDNGSTASFCTKDLLCELGVATTKCHLLLATVSNVEENCFQDFKISLIKNKALYKVV